MNTVVFQANSSSPPMSLTTEGSSVEPMKVSIACSATPPAKTAIASPLPAATMSRQPFVVACHVVESLAAIQIVDEAATT